MDTSLLDRVPTIAIGVAAKLLDVSVSSIRQYESVGLILLHHESNGRRLLAAADIERLELLKQKITKNGFNFEGLRRILALVPCWEIKSCTEEEQSRCPGFQDHVTLAGWLQIICVTKRD